MNSSNTSNTATTPQKVGPTVDQLFRRLKHDRGAVLVEAAIAIPLLLFVILGSLEFGIAWETKSSTTNGMRSGLLRAATLADQPQTDLRVLQSIIGEVGAEDSENISWVVIFNADPSFGSIDDIVDACSTPLEGGATSETLPSYCVGYTQDTIQQVATTTEAATFLEQNFDDGSGLNEATGNYTCQPGNLDSGDFCAGSRTVDGDIQVGVAFEYEHEWLTGILPFDEPTFSEQQVTSTFAVDGIEITAESPATFGGALHVGTTFSGGSLPDAITPPAGVTVMTADNGVNYLGPIERSMPVLIDVNVGTDTEVCIQFDAVFFSGWDPIEDNLRIRLNDTGEVRTRNNFDFGNNSGDGTLGDEEGNGVVIAEQCFDVTGEGPDVQLAIITTTTADAETYGITDLQVTSNP